MRFVGLRTLLICSNPLKPSKPQIPAQTRQHGEDSWKPSSPRQEPAHSWESHTSETPPASPPRCPNSYPYCLPHPPNPMPASVLWIHFSTLVSILPLSAGCVESQRMGCHASDGGRTWSLCGGEWEEPGMESGGRCGDLALTSRSNRLHLSPPHL